MHCFPVSTNSLSKIEPYLTDFSGDKELAMAWVYKNMGLVVGEPTLPILMEWGSKNDKK